MKLITLRSILVAAAAAALFSGFANVGDAFAAKTD